MKTRPAFSTMCASSTFLHCGQIDRVKPKNAASLSFFAGIGSIVAILCESAAVEDDHSTIQVRVPRRRQPRRKLATFCRLSDPPERTCVDVSLLMMLRNRRAQPDR